MSAVKAGDVFIADDYGTSITVRRVARDMSWADIRVETMYSMWTKRQRLVNGAFPFPVRQIKGAK